MGFHIHTSPYTHHHMHARTHSLTHVLVSDQVCHGLHCLLHSQVLQATWLCKLRGNATWTVSKSELNSRPPTSHQSLAYGFYRPPVLGEKAKVKSSDLTHPGNLMWTLSCSAASEPCTLSPLTWHDFFPSRESQLQHLERHPHFFFVQLCFWCHQL